MKHRSFLQKTRAAFMAHKILYSVIAAVIVIGGYEMYRSAKTADAETQYVLSQATIGSIIQTVSGSGQVTAANQLDVTSKASGELTGIDVTVGQAVKKGDLIATIDPTDAVHSLTSARLSYAQLTEAPKAGDVVNAQNSVEKSYSDGWNSVSNSFVDLQTAMSGLNAMLYSQTGFLGTANAASLNPTAQTYRTSAGQSFDKANAQYQTVLNEYQGLTRASATTSITQIVSDTYDLLKNVSVALADTQNTLTYIAANQPTYQSKDLSTAQQSVTSWLNSINSDVSSVSSAGNSILSDANTLNNLITGPDELQVEASQLSVQQAEETYSDYFVRAPFDGVIGRLPTAIYAQAGGSTVIATVIGANKVANISLNEVDAAKVVSGDKVNITFDAIDGLNATGTVESVDLVGAVSQGVVSYNVKISINTDDDRIRPGMSFNASIVTEEKDGVLIVPSAAIKTQGTRSYVQVLASSTIMSYMQKLAGNATVSGATGTAGRNFAGRSASTTGTFGNASSTGGFRGGFASTTRTFGSATGSTGTTRAASTLTVPSPTAPTAQVVVTGLSDDTNTEIVSGLAPRSWIVTRTIAGSSATTATAAPSLLNSLGGNRAGAAGGATLRTGAATGGGFRAGGGFGG